MFAGDLCTVTSQHRPIGLRRTRARPHGRGRCSPGRQESEEHMDEQQDEIEELQHEVKVPRMGCVGLRGVALPGCVPHKHAENTWRT